jgi:uncharacterized protein
MSGPPASPGVATARAFRQFVLKIHSRCDLACDHCYVYEAADQSWRGRPMAIPDAVMARTAERIAEHAVAHELPAVQVVLHGGEPLLAGPARLRRLITEFRAALRPVCALDLRVHTNGVLLSEELCELFAEHDVKVGISIDGDRIANDRHRRYADGRSSYDKVIAAIGLLQSERFRKLYAGLLCTIDVANDPIAVYESLLQLRPPRIDFLLPHSTWDSPPPRAAAESAQYGDWLVAIFDRWIASGRPVSIRTFDSILSTLRGGESLTEALGLGAVDLVVIETDGSYEQADSLKAAFDGAPATGFDVFGTSLDVVARHPGVMARQQGLAGLCRTCQECPVVTSCGGGMYAHRHRADTGFENPSVFCPDLLKLITHIDARDPAGPTPPAGFHRLGGSEFRALATGLGDAAAIGQLSEAQRSLRRALIAGLYRAASTSAAVSGERQAGLRAAWDLLSVIDTAQPQALESVLSHPYVRVWAMGCLTALRSSATAAPSGPEPGEGRELDIDLAHLGAIAAVAAIRAQTSARVTVPVIRGAVHLPTLGRLVLNSAGPGHRAGVDATAAMDVTESAVIVRAGDDSWRLDRTGLLAGGSCAVTASGAGAAAEWQPVRMLRAPGLTVALEDTDPYRESHQWKAAPRLTDSEVARWQERFLAAWQEIAREHGVYGPALAAGLTTVTPLMAAPEGRHISAAARQAFGAVAAALPADPVILALLLIHEFQHVKLGAVLDLYDLFDLSDQRLYHAPWREDKRPIEGLLQGTYAHLAVTDFWRARQRAAIGPVAEEAGKQFTRWRAHTAAAIETLSDSGSLTSLGAQFVDEMRHSACL